MHVCTQLNTRLIWIGRLNEHFQGQCEQSANGTWNQAIGANTEKFVQIKPPILSNLEHGGGDIMIWASVFIYSRENSRYLFNLRLIKGEDSWCKLFSWGKLTNTATSNSF